MYSSRYRQGWAECGFGAIGKAGAEYGLRATGKAGAECGLGATGKAGAEFKKNTETTGSLCPGSLT